MAAGLYFLFGLLLAILVVPVVRKYSVEGGYLDRPEKDPFKTHTVPIPHSGGLAIFAVFNLLLIGTLFLNGHDGRIRVTGLFIGGIIAWAIGVRHDLKEMNHVFRLGGEILAGLVLVTCGMAISVPLGIGALVSVFYVVGAINAVNVVDGLDGLAGGFVLISAAGFSLLCVLGDRGSELAIPLILIGVLAGFLIYNFNPASIFMGDGGSYFLGFILAYLAISFTSLDNWTRFLGPILILGIPVIDISYAIVRRIRKGVSPCWGDRDHIYDQLVQKGLSVRQAVLICWAVQAALVTTGVWIYQF